MSLRIICDVSSRELTTNCSVTANSPSKLKSNRLANGFNFLVANATVNGGKSFLFSIPYDPPKQTTFYDVALYADGGIIDLDFSKYVERSPAVCGQGAGKGIAVSNERIVSNNDRPENFGFSLSRWGESGRTIKVCVQVVYLNNWQELGRDYFVAELNVRQP